MQTFTDSASFVLRFINQTNRSIFLTGKAGTGKTTLLKEIIRTTHKNTVVVAPTGIAALNAGGVTIHSMFQLPFAAFIPDHSGIPQVSEHVRIETKNTLRRHFRVSGIKQSVMRNMELLIIDEVSMLRSDLLDAMEYMLQSVRKNSAPFGGVQVLFIGDLLQLPPVVKNEEWAILKKYYQGKFFFQSHAIQKSPPLYIELSKIFRQTDQLFIEILNNLRHNKITSDDIDALNQFVQPDFDLKKNKGYVMLTTHNAKADAINCNALDELEGQMYTYTPEVTDDFPEKLFPVEQNLNLKVGAQIMFVKNDPSTDKNYFNGKTGIIKSLSTEEIFVHFPDENRTIEIERYEWRNIRYTVDEMTKEINEEVLGTFVHYPIKLAWAMTVHKSQGLTFDKAALDVSQVFLPGQAYVALSRLRSLDGLVLLSPMRMNGISSDTDVMTFAENKSDDVLLANSLELETRKFINNYLKSSFDWRELAQQWRSHRFSYNDEMVKSEKSKHKKWAEQQSNAIDLLVDPAVKFMAQLDRLFTVEQFDMGVVSERVHAAFAYFFDPMDQLVSALIWKMQEVRRVKKAKTFYMELHELEELQTRAVIYLLKAKKMIDALNQHKEICRENLIDEEIKHYKFRKAEKIKAQFHDNNITLIEDDQDIERYSARKKTKSKEPKKSTVEETFELWRQNNSIDEIAKVRKLTKQTINNHFAKLIQTHAVKISDVMGEDKISELADAFQGYNEETVNGLKEKYGDKFTWDELKLYKASLT